MLRPLFFIVQVTLNRKTYRYWVTLNGSLIGSRLDTQLNLMVDPHQRCINKFEYYVSTFFCGNIMSAKEINMTKFISCLESILSVIILFLFRRFDKVDLEHRCSKVKSLCKLLHTFFKHHSTHKIQSKFLATSLAHIQPLQQSYSWAFHVLLLNVFFLKFTP